MRLIDADVLKYNWINKFGHRRKLTECIDEQPSICCENCNNWYDIEEQGNKTKIGCCDSLYNFFNGDDIATSMKSYADDFCSYYEPIKKKSAD